MISHIFCDQVLQQQQQCQLCSAGVLLWWSSGGVGGSGVTAAAEACEHSAGCIDPSQHQHHSSPLHHRPLHCTSPAALLHYIQHPCTSHWCPGAGTTFTPPWSPCHWCWCGVTRGLQLQCAGESEWRHCDRATAAQPSPARPAASTAPPAAIADTHTTNTQLHLCSCLLIFLLLPNIFWMLPNIFRI